MEPRRIAFIVSPWFSVPPEGYGGIELMAYNLAVELSRRGHEITVIGRQGTRGPFNSVALAPESWASQLGTEAEAARQNLFLYRAYEVVRKRAFDVIHDHSGPSGILVAATSSLRAPVVATLHGPVTEAEADFLAAVDHEVHLVAVSSAQQTTVAGVEWRGMVHNAVDSTQYRRITDRAQKEDYLVEVARISPEKGQHLAIDLAERLGARLVLAGKVDIDSRDYFKEKVEPRLNDRIMWRENVGGQEKFDLLAKARALLFPIQWDEPFGLAMVEAMVSGTPVIATPRGAAPELVEPGVTGWLAGDVDEMESAYHRLDEIDLERCADEAARRFGPAQMADGYYKVYERAIEQAIYCEPI